MLATNWTVARRVTSNEQDRIGSQTGRRERVRGESKLFVENHINESTEYNVRVAAQQPREFQFYTQAHFNARRAQSPGLRSARN